MLGPNRGQWKGLVEMLDRELTGPKTGLRWAAIVVAGVVGLSVCKGMGLSKNTRGVCTVKSSETLARLCESASR